MITYSKGQRVAIHPAHDLWMRGAKTGHVTSVRRHGVYLAPIVNGRALHGKRYFIPFTYVMGFAL